MSSGVLFGVICYLMIAAPVTRQQLRVGSATTVLGQAAPLLMQGNVKTDEDGNAYFQVYEGTLNSPLIKVSRDGRRVVRFDLSQLPKFKNTSQILDYAVSPNGDVFMLLARRSVEAGTPDEFIVSFERHGEVASVVRVESGERRLRRLAAFASGEFLVAGWDGEVGRGRPYLGIVDQSGRSTARVRLSPAKGELKPPVLEGRKTRSELAAEIDAYQLASELSLMVTTRDGFAYVATRGGNGPIYKVGSRGNVHRIFHPQRPDSDARLTDMRVSNGRMVLMYGIGMNQPRTRGMPTIVLSVLDLATGDEVAQFTYSDPKIGLALVSYDRDGFTFLGNDGAGHLQFVSAQP